MRSAQRGNADSLKDQTVPCSPGKKSTADNWPLHTGAPDLHEDLLAPVERKLNRTYEGTHYGLPLLAAVFTGEHRVLGSIDINHGKYFISFGARKRRIPE